MSKKRSRQPFGLIHIFVASFVILAASSFLLLTKQHSMTLGVSQAVTPLILKYVTGGSSYVWNEESAKRSAGNKWIGTGSDSTGSYSVITVIGTAIPKGTTVSSAILSFSSLQAQSTPLYASIHAELSPGTHGGMTAGQWPKTTNYTIFKLLATSPWQKDQRITVDVTPVITELVNAEGTKGTINFVLRGGTSLNERRYIYGGDAPQASLYPSLSITTVVPVPTPTPSTLPKVTPTPSPVPTPVPTPIPSPSPVATPVSNSTQFIKRSGGDLYLDGKRIRLVGANIFWLGLDTSGGVNYYPTQFRIEDALTTAKEMGANVIRSHGAISVGCSVCIEPSLNTFNEAGFQSLDTAIATGKKLGLRFIFPLSDNYQYYHGGKYVFTNWRGVANEEFFTNPTVISDYLTYVRKILNHVNPQTGLAYKDDPTIAAWETGNELYVGSAYSKTSFAPWTNTVSTEIKKLAPNQLVIDGRYGVDDASLSLANVDMYSNHYRLGSQIPGEGAYVAKAGKAYLLGEFDWTGKRLDVTLAQYLQTIGSSDIDAVAYWSLFGHADAKGFQQHGDGYTLHYPGDTADMKTRVQQLRAFAYSLRGLTAPAIGVPATPSLLGSTLLPAGVSLTFRGSALSDHYEIARSTDNGASWLTVSNAVDEKNLPFTDTGSWSGTALYKVRGVNLSGVAGQYSSTVSLKK